MIVKLILIIHYKDVKNIYKSVFNQKIILLNMFKNVNKIISMKIMNVGKYVLKVLIISMMMKVI